jgi:pimeloyl-ACP methyl ester carboxylesterase
MCTPAAAQVEAQDVHVPRFEKADCPFTASNQVLDQVRCGWLIVHENRTAPDGRQLRLAVAVMKSMSPAPRPDPIVFLSGGPGGNSVEHIPGRTRHGFWNALRAEREVVFFDQRGTGYSEPEFCSEITDESFRITFLGLSAQERSARLQTALASCAEVMRDQGVDLSQYNSVASAHDLQDLMQALGYEEWNLFGVSYGTRLGLEALRTAPAGIRSAVFDSPSPPNAPQGGGRNVHFVDVVHRLAAACAADTACDTAYPDLEQRIWQTAEELEREPWLVRSAGGSRLPDTIEVDGTLFIGGLFRGMHDRNFIPIAPLFVDEVRRRNSAMLVAMSGPLSRSARDLSRAMNLAVRCYESVPFYGLEHNASLEGDYPEILEQIGYRVGSGTPEECDAWHPYRAGAEHAEPVSSDIPTLVLTGEFDPVTHRSFGALAVHRLTNGHVVEAPAMGHAVSPLHPCTRSIVAAFLDNPARTPDATCVDTDMDPVRFVTDVRVSPGVGRIASVMGSGSASNLLSAALGLPLLVLIGSAVGWPAAAGVRRLRRRQPVASAPFERQAQWGAMAFTLLALGFLVGLAWAIMQTRAENPMILLFGLPGWAAPLLLLPWLLLAGSVVLMVTAVLTWRRGVWTQWGRIHFTLVAIASAVLAGVLFAVGLA